MIRKYTILIVISLSALIIDQLIKHWIVLNVRFGGHKTIFNSSLFELYFTNVRNKGAAFSLFSGMPIWFFILVSIVAILIILYFFSKVGKEQLALIISLSLVLGGAGGNLADRILHHYVIDYVGTLFILGNFPGYKYLPEFVHKFIHNRIGGPPFNFADVTISIGVIILIYIMVIKGEEFGELKDKSKEEKKTDEKLEKAQKDDFLEKDEDKKEVQLEKGIVGEEEKLDVIEGREDKLEKEEEKLDVIEGKEDKLEKEEPLKEEERDIFENIAIANKNSKV